MLLRGKFPQLGGYFLATIVTAAVSFFSVPLIIRILGAEQFGKWSLLEPLQLLLSQFMLLGINYGIVKQINFDKSPPFPTFVSLFRCSQPLFIILSIIALTALPYFGFLHRDSWWFALLIYVEATLALVLSFYRAASSVSGYTSGTIAKAVVFFSAIMIAIFFNNHQAYEVSHIITWRFLSAVFAIALSLYIYRVKCCDPSPLLRHSNLTSWHIYRDAFKYGWPFLVTGLLTMVIDFADRYILKAYFDYTTLAHYVVYSKIAAFLNPLIISPLGLWWPTERFKRIQDTDGGKRFFRQTALKILIVFLLFGGALWLLSPWVITLFAPGVTAEPRIQLMLIASVIFMGMGAPLNIGLLDTGKTHLIIYGVLGGAVIHIILCIMLIPSFGATGAALSTALSYLSYTLLLNILSQRLTPIPFAYISMLVLIIISFGVLFFISSMAGGSGLYACMVRTISYISVFSLAAAAVFWFSKTRYQNNTRKRTDNYASNQS